MWGGATRWIGRSSCAALAAALALALAGCGSSPTRIEVTLIGAEDLNPDPDGRPKPLVVRMYELKSDTAFKGASFDDLIEGDVARLGTDLQDKEEVLLTPGQVLEFERELKPETRVVGFTGNYRLYERGGLWRAAVAVPEGETTELKVDFKRSEIVVEAYD
ncbi:MAG: type VI secretion system lipoprotein TssJ [Kiloniellales bacterium]|nr:type VI secretion system lipoprotein TssJ [Kiloniellales bacterium]